MHSILFIHTTLLILLSHPIQSQSILQCGDFPEKCINETNSTTWPCCCFANDQAGCNARPDCFFKKPPEYDKFKCAPLETTYPTLYPTFTPTEDPTNNPTSVPTISPTSLSTIPPTTPTINPTNAPTKNPTSIPTYIPTDTPTKNPTSNPSRTPTTTPTNNPSNTPTITPTTMIPTDNPSKTPTKYPTTDPTQFPSINPTYMPTATTNEPTPTPTPNPTIHPIPSPTPNPTLNPTLSPTFNPTIIPTQVPAPIISSNPTIIPTYMPTNDCIECEIYNLTLININANISVKECEIDSRDSIEYSNCDCNGNGMIELNMKYITQTFARKIEIFYNDNIILCTFYNVELNTDIICNVKYGGSDYFSFKTITKFKVYYKENNINYFCIGEYDTSCNTYILGNVDTQCPHLMMNGWIDYNNNNCFNDGTNVHIKYWTKRTIYSDSSNHKNNKRNKYKTTKKQSYISNDRTNSGSSRRRRRRLGNGISTKCVWDNHHDSKSVSGNWHKNNGNKCDDSSDSSDSSYGQRRSLLWGNYYGSSSSSDSSDSSSEDGPIKILYKVCLTYEIGILNDDCDILDSVFLPLCENNQTSFNSSSVSTDDITNLIIDYEPNNGIIPIGYRDENNTLGILVMFLNNTYTIEQFELCLANVTIDVNVSANYSHDAIDIADTVTFVIDNESSICQSDGLPCLNFYFVKDCTTTSNDKTVKSCNCNKGLESITFLYSGHNIVDKIEIFNRRRHTKLLCEFNSVLTDDALICNGPFQRRIYVTITYSNTNICDGFLRTDCTNDICGNMLLNNCINNNDLSVIGWIDKKGAICDETVKDNTIARTNALINDKYTMVGGNTLQIFNDLDIYVKWALIGMIIMFVILICIGFNICAFGRFYHKNIGFQSPKISNNNHHKIPSLSIVKHFQKMCEMEQIKRNNIDQSIINNTIHEEKKLDELETSIEQKQNQKHQRQHSRHISHSRHQSHSKHKSINFDEEEIIGEIIREMEEFEPSEFEDEEKHIYDETTIATCAVSGHHKHKSINLNEEEYINIVKFETENDEKEYSNNTVQIKDDLSSNEFDNDSIHVNLSQNQHDDDYYYDDDEYSGTVQYNKHYDYEDSGSTML